MLESPARQLPRYLLTSIVLLIPCFWLPRIHAGDLSSHVYNAWLANEVEAGRAPGLHLVNQWTNIVFDQMLAHLLPITGPGWAQRLSVSMCVLLFFWGLFEWIRSQSGDAWTVSPALMMLAYGRIFHMGLFNFYLALGLAFLALACFRRTSVSRILGVVLLALSILAHALGTFIVAFVAFVLWVGKSVRPLTFALGAAMTIMLMLLGRLVFPQWFVVQFRFFSPEAFGLSQFQFYGSEFGAITVALLTILLLMIATDREHTGLRHQLARGEIRLLLFSLVLSAITPWAVWLPGFSNALGYLDLRASFIVAVSLTLLCSRQRFCFSRWAALAAVALAYFCCLYLRVRPLDAIESRVEAAVKQIPRGSRVVSSLRMKNEILDLLEHMVDRACVGHCYSYANYEPPSEQFRLRSDSRSPIVIADIAKGAAIDSGHYVVEDSDTPIWVLYCRTIPADEVLSRQLMAGEIVPIQPFVKDELTGTRQVKPGD